MRLTSILLVASVLGLCTVPVAAQTVASWQEVQVNPVRPGGNGVLLYPGGEYSRMVPPLLYPGERGGPIQLHMPAPHRRRVASAEPSRPRPVAPKPVAPPRTERPAPAPKVARAPKPAPAPKVASAAPTTPPPADFNPFGGASNLSNVFGNSPPAPKTAPAGPTTGNESLSKRSMILFAKDAPDPAKSALGNIRFLAQELNSAMSTPNARIELQGFGGAKGDKGSDARRLSLKRALAIRQVLIDDGVSSDRIDVHAMGGVDDTGPTDRVDVYVKA
ncbi:MAG TPA: OmpA family protein [Rhizomicrobium sp.]|nr:OmpA family protein [Rhizomicrobium sp.]